MTPANPLSSQPPIRQKGNPFSGTEYGSGAPQNTSAAAPQSQAPQGVFQKIGLVLPGIANRLAAAFGNYTPLHEEQRQQQLGMQQQLQNSTLQDQSLNRRHLQQQIDNFQTPEQQADLQVKTRGRMNDLEAPKSEINVNPAGELTRDEYDSATKTWKPQTHQVPNPALASYNEPAVAPKPNYVTNWQGGAPPGMPKTIPEPVHPLPPAPMLGVTYGPTVQDPTGQYVQDQRSKLTGKSVGAIPVGGTPVPALPTTNYSSTNKVERDVNNNLVNVPETSVNTRVRGGGAASPMPPVPGVPRAGAGRATPIMGADGNQLHAPLGADAKKNISQISTTEKMISQILPELEARIKQSGGDMNNLWDAGMQRAAWAEYNHGGVIPDNIDPVLAHLLPTIAQLKIVGGLPYLRGTRSFQYIQQIQQHLPDPEKDSPALMIDKIHSLQRTMPILRQSVLESEGINSPAPPPALAVPGTIDPKNPLGL